VSKVTCVIDRGHGSCIAAGNDTTSMTQPEPATATAGRTAWGHNLQTPLRQFLQAAIAR